ncbi:hypothetical protein [Tsuneonella mangrovi]|uniref:hypothetical protein n=1 Tax=Tsuneonella mangrovi TaxID=1982042 RepID=UPI001F0B2746|nr:hypothetical protein [Tsuneonella mangrovi]
MSDPTPTRKIARQATSAVAFTAEPPEDDNPLLAFPPYRHAAPRRNSITPELQRRFVSTLAATGIVTQAAKSIGKSMEALYKLRARPGAEGFAAAWDAALERGVSRLEDCALERAIQGTPTPIVSGGELLGYWDKPDNNLLRFLLQHRLSERYGVQKLKPGHPVYESIRAEVLAEEAKKRDESEEDVIRSLTDRLERMRQRQVEQGTLWIDENGRGHAVPPEHWPDKPWEYWPERAPDGSPHMTRREAGDGEGWGDDDDDDDDDGWAV